MTKTWSYEENTYGANSEDENERVNAGSDWNNEESEGINDNRKRKLINYLATVEPVTQKQKCGSRF